MAKWDMLIGRMKELALDLEIAVAMEPEKPKYLPCPFCGNLNTDFSQWARNCVQCNDCKAQGPLGGEPIEAWNKRA